MQPVDIITVPYDSGRRGWRMGAGPGALLDTGLVDTLREWGHDARVLEVALGADGPADVLAATMELAHGTARHVRDARAHGHFPLVLAGNCFTTVGAHAGLDLADVAVAWFDAHGDLNTPATSRSGFLDGMAAATLLGWCHTAATAELTGFRPLPVRRFLLIGARDLDAPEADAAARERVRLLSPEQAARAATEQAARAAPEQAARAAAEHAEAARALDDAFVGSAGVWLHIDLDVLDPDELAPANAFATPGGLTLYQTLRILQETGARSPVVGLTLSAYDPAADEYGLVPRAALALISEALVAAAGLSAGEPRNLPTHGLGGS